MIAQGSETCLLAVDEHGHEFEWGEGVPHWPTEEKARENLAQIDRAYAEGAHEPPLLTLRREPAPCWHLTCDGCGYRFDESEWVSHFRAGSEIDETFLFDYEWETSGEKHYCPACVEDGAA